MVVAILLTDTLVLKLKMDSEEDSSVLCSSLNDVTGDDDLKLNFCRQENLYWYQCTHCYIMPTIIECRCCRECENLLEEKLDRVKCITEQEIFLYVSKNCSQCNTSILRSLR